MPNGRNGWTSWPRSCTLIVLELRHLKTLQALAECGTLSAAAKRVHLTQSAVSHQIKVLEARYETSLFARKSDPFRLTPAGQRLLEAGRDILRIVDTAEADIARLNRGDSGSLRIAVECHTCFDWLMPAMDAFRADWPAVELDLVSGFHSAGVELLASQRADLVVVSEQSSQRDIVSDPLFGFEIVCLLANTHPLAQRRVIYPTDFADETLITYPVPEEMLDVVQRVLKPAGVFPPRRTAELTVAILQLVASGRGIAALPAWSVEPYLARGYVTAKRIGRRGLWSKLFAATLSDHAAAPYMQAFLKTVRNTSFARLKGIRP